MLRDFCILHAGFDRFKPVYASLFSSPLPLLLLLLLLLLFLLLLLLLLLLFLLLLLLLLHFQINSEQLITPHIPQTQLWKFNPI